MILVWIALSVTATLALCSWAMSCFACARRHRHAVFIVVGAFSFSHFPISWWLLSAQSVWALTVHVIVVSVLLAACCALGPLLLVRGIRVALRRARSENDVPELPERRRVLETVVGTAFMVTAGGTLGWGSAFGRSDFELSEVPILIPGLPRTLDGYVIVQISDLHAGHFVDQRHFDLGATLVARAKPDLIVVTGDLVDFDPRFAPLAARFLANLPQRDGVECVLGNHDYYTGARAVREALRRVGLAPLNNSHRIVRPGDGGGFALLGVDDLSAPDFGAKGPDFAQAASGVSADLPRILLSHQPATIERFAGHVALQLSGHTHGGQINPLHLLDHALPYMGGRFVVQGTELYVNRGFGTVGPPSRVSAPPEVTRLVLVAA